MRPLAGRASDGLQYVRRAPRINGFITLTHSHSRREHAIATIGIGPVRNLVVARCRMQTRTREIGGEYHGLQGSDAGSHRHDLRRRLCRTRQDGAGVFTVGKECQSRFRTKTGNDVCRDRKLRRDRSRRGPEG